MQVSCPIAQLEGLPEESILPCGDTNASEKPSRNKKKKLWRGVSKDVSFHLRSKEKDELQRKEETKKI